jgi:hypothetical protein
MLMLDVGGGHNRDCYSGCDYLVYDPETPQEETRQSEVYPDEVSETKMGELESYWIYAKGQL